LSGKDGINNKILIVDDDKSIREILADYLSILGYKIFRAENGKKAIKILSRENISCALIDMMMPVMSGIELIDYINENFPLISFIVISGITEIDIVKSALRKGAYDYLIKPIDIIELDITVKRAIEREKLIIENIEYKENLEMIVNEQTKYIKKMVIKSINAMITTLEARDKYTKGHSKRVSYYSVSLGKGLNLNKNTIEQLRIASLLHDIGKIGVRDDILSKKGPLTVKEMCIIQKHPVIGEKILSNFINNEDILMGVKHHHEHYNGNGYPDGLENDNIPYFSRIINICDSFDAMTSDRPYRRSFIIDKALKDIYNKRYIQYDPYMADVFIDLLMNGKITLKY